MGGREGEQGVIELSSTSHIRCPKSTHSPRACSAWVDPSTPEQARYSCSQPPLVCPWGSSPAPLSTKSDASGGQSAAIAREGRDDSRAGDSARNRSRIYGSRENELGTPERSTALLSPSAGFIEHGELFTSLSVQLEAEMCTSIRSLAGGPLTRLANPFSAPRQASSPAPSRLISLISS